MNFLIWLWRKFISLFKTVDPYVLNVGDSAKSNLDLQHTILYQSTLSQLKKAGLDAKMTAWDIGCGSGNVVEMLANEVGPLGKVFANDISQEQINVTSKRLNSLGISNIEYVVGSIDDLKPEDFPKADCVHSRLLLMHLNDVKRTLSTMCAFLKSKGVILSQESSMDSLQNLHTNKAIDRYYELIKNYGEKYNLNFNVGSKLESIFQKFGKFGTIECYNTKFPLDTAQGNALLFSRFGEIKDKLIAEGLTDETEMAEIEKAMRSYEIVENSEDSKIYTLQTHIIAKLK